MCGSGGDSSKYARRQDNVRNANIDAGKIALERIFAPLEGASYELTNPQLAGVSRQQYVEQALQRWGVTDGRDVKRAVKYANAEYEALLRAPHSYTRTAGETTPIWEQNKRAYTQYAMPELARQQQDAREQLGFALQRQGVGSSSIAGDRWAQQAGEFARAEQDVVEGAREVESQAKADIARQKQQLLSMLSSTGDAGGAAESARLAVESLRSPPRVEPLGVLFQNTTAGLAGGLNAYQQGKQVGRYNNIVYGGDPDRGSGRIVR